MPDFLRDKQGSTILKTLGVPQELWPFPAPDCLIFDCQSSKPSLFLRAKGEFSAALASPSPCQDAFSCHCLDMWSPKDSKYKF